jgi:hypothetical protein
MFAGGAVDFEAREGGVATCVGVPLSRGDANMNCRALWYITALLSHTAALGWLHTAF